MTPEELKALQDQIKAQLETVASDIKGLIEGQKEEIKKTGEITVELKTEIDKLNNLMKGLITNATDFEKT